jgi:phospholipid/cholesterol/gamma-HCH transport system substrate-binding protein
MIKPRHNIKLGVFVLSGLLFLVVMLYMIGRNSNMFGKNYVLKARFSNVQGLVPGNNVRFSGIEAGTVKNISILSDTIIEVSMIIDDEMKKVIRKTALASIGTEGLVGNKVLNIIPSGVEGPLAEDGDILPAGGGTSTDAMLKTLSGTNNDIAQIVADLKITVQRINGSKALWALLNDSTIPADLHAAVGNVRKASADAQHLAGNLDDIVSAVKAGEGSVGAMLKDTSFADNLQQAIVSVRSAGEKADLLVAQMDSLIAGIKKDIGDGKGTVNVLLKDSVMAGNLNQSMVNIKEGTAAFNQNMEALKHNFLFRGYFKKQEKKKAKATQ